MGRRLLAALMLSVATVATATVATAAEPGIRPAPAFAACDLAALPTDGWLTNGGNLANQRYSPLTQ